MAYAVHIKLEELEKDNKELRAMLAVQAAQIERNKQTIYLYAGGFYNRKEREILEDHLNILEEQDFDEDYKSYIEDQIESIWPRTREGILHGRQLEENKNDTAELKKIIAAQAAQIERNTTTIYQLLGGLFNQRTQARILNVHMSGLFVQDGASACEAAHDEAAHDEAADEAAHDEAAHDEDDEAADEDEELENVWPTTRQGDEHSERLKEMEERFRKLEEQVVAMEKRQLEKFGSTE